MALRITKIRTTRFLRSGTQQEERIELPLAHSIALPDGYHRVSDGLAVKYVQSDGVDILDAWHISEAIPAELTA